MAEPVSTCDTCGKSDDHPKLQLSSGQFFHMDCPSIWHDRVTNPDPHPDPATNAAIREHADRHARIIALAKSGVHGADLRARIVGGNV